MVNQETYKQFVKRFSGSLAFEVGYRAEGLMEVEHWYEEYMSNSSIDLLSDSQEEINKKQKMDTSVTREDQLKFIGDLARIGVFTKYEYLPDSEDPQDPLGCGVKLTVDISKAKQFLNMNTPEKEIKLKKRKVLYEAGVIHFADNPKNHYKPRNTADNKSEKMLKSIFKEGEPGNTINGFKHLFDGETHRTQKAIRDLNKAINKQTGSSGPNLILVKKDGSLVLNHVDYEITSRHM